MSRFKYKLLTAGFIAALLNAPAWTQVAERPGGELAIKTALARISAQSPQEYPELVTPVPEPGGFAETTDAELLEMLDVWNPALRRRVADALGSRGKQVIPALVEALSSDLGRRRSGALVALERVIRVQVRNWQEFRPEETNPQAAQASIRQEFADLLLDKLVDLTKDPDLDVRNGALAVINALSLQGRQVSKAVLTLCVDENEYLADQALAVLGRTGIADIESEILLPVFRKALQNPLPRGKGPIIQMIARSEESFRRALIPDLLAHLDWQPDRDTMFGASGQADALNLLTRLRVKELVPRLPALMDKTMRGPGLFDHCMKSIIFFGNDAQSILPILRERIARKEAEITTLAGRNDRRSLGRAEHLQKRLEALREAVNHVEK